jgi:hypothetical protein
MKEHRAKGQDKIQFVFHQPPFTKTWMVPIFQIIITGMKHYDPLHYTGSWSSDAKGKPTPEGFKRVDIRVVSADSYHEFKKKSSKYTSHDLTIYLVDVDQLKTWGMTTSELSENGIFGVALIGVNPIEIANSMYSYANKHSIH